MQFDEASITHLVVALSMLGTAPGDIADGVTGLHLAGDEGTLVVSPTDEQRLAVVSTLDRVGWYHPAGRVAPAHTSRVEPTNVHRGGRRRAGIYNYVMLSKEGPFQNYDIGVRKEKKVI